jgi:hypothetical protein
VSKEVEYEVLQVYRFFLEYPAYYQLQIARGSSITEGKIDFLSKENPTISLSWGDLENARKRYQDAKSQAEGTLCSIQKTFEKGGAKFQLINQTNIDVSGHLAVLSLSEASISGLLPKSIKKRVIRSSHVHCPESKRWLVLYQMTKLEEHPENPEPFEHMIKTLDCHRAAIRMHS